MSKNKEVNLAWNDVNWTQVKTRVSRLQNRIYKAIIDGKTDVVHYL